MKCQQIEYIDKQGVGWKGGRRTRQYSEYVPEKLPKSMRNLIKGCDNRYDPSYFQNGSIDASMSSIE